MKDVYLVSGCRSPIGRGHPEKGLYADLRADELAVQVLDHLIRRTGLDANTIDDLYLGCVGQHLEQGKNLARLIILLAGLPSAIPGVTINRLCASSLTALQMATDSIRAETNSLVVVGGVEHMGHVPMTAALDYNSDLFTDSPYQWTNMGLTAEELAVKYAIDRAAQDEFTIMSNERYFTAWEAGFYDDEVVPINLRDNSVVQQDQEPRRSTAEQLAGLKTIFAESGTVTAANASGVSDGACMALVCGEEQLGNRQPLARIRATVQVGLDPREMGLGPVPAVRRLLDISELDINDIDLFEINEAFAVQVLACTQELELDLGKVNIHGGAVALGHPLGMSGLRLAITLGRSLHHKNLRYGIATMCVGHGQGVAMLLERA